ncbi:MAG: sodium:alanine symporter family protein [Puniceicoccales bacterium]|jgi:AGCS family alanine or glycine:cation symporter|nr:sodium:alanine symporter family protein [Puniceicoccales bacterium]
MLSLREILVTINNLLWGPPLILILGGMGLYFTVKLRLLQIIRFPRALSFVFRGDDGHGDVSHFASLCTALSATIGTGSVVGVSTAIVAGGPGALFWMWIMAFLGMATKYAEGFLAIKFRRIGEDGKIAGGPMHYIEMGTGIRWLAKIFAICGILAALLGMGTFAQVNSITMAVGNFGVSKFAAAIPLTLLVAVIICGGIRRISLLSGLVVPFMCAFHVIASLVILGIHFRDILPCLGLIVRGAFRPRSIFGGSLGVGLFTVMQMGVSRGTYATEAGWGSAAIAAAAAKTNAPQRQGLVCMTGVFFSTIVCTMTGLVVIITREQTNLFQTSLEGIALISQAFSANIGIAGRYVVNFGLIFFAFTTIIGWNYYGEKCFQYLFGLEWLTFYRIVFIAMIALGPLLRLDTIFIISDICSGLMVVPNLIGLFLLRKLIIRESTPI